MVNNIGQIDVKINTGDITKAIAELNNLGKAASNAQSRLDGLSKTNLSGLTGQFSALNKELSSVDNSAAKAAKSIDGIAGKSLGGFGSQITVINNNFTQTITAVSQVNAQINKIGGGAAGALGGVGKLVGGLAALKVGIEVAEELYKIGKAAYDAYQPIQSLTMGLNALGKNGAVELAAMRQQAQSLGIVFSDTAKSQLQWAAATQQTNLEGDKGAKVFESISGAIRLFGGGTEEVNGSLKALTQMMSKGTVQSEELKGQLGERLPGAFRLMADALGISTRELTDALKNGMVESGYAIEKLSDLIDKRYGEGIKNAANTTQSQLNRMKNDWQTIMAGIGREIDAAVGKIATLINQWGVLRGLGAGFEGGGITDNINNLGKVDGTGAGKANRIFSDANTLLEAKGQQGIKQGSRRPLFIGDRTTETVAEAIGRDAADTSTKLSALRARGDTQSAQFKALEQRLKIIQDASNANKDIKAQGADRAAAEGRARRDAAEFADSAKASRERQDAIRSGDQRALLGLDIQKARKQIEDAAKTMSGRALAEFRNDREEYIASREAQIKKLDEKGSRAGARAASERDRQANRADDIVRGGQTELSRLRERYQNLTDPDGIEGEIERVKRLFAERRAGIAELTKLTAKEKEEKIAALDAEERESIEQIKKIDAVNDSKKTQRKIEQEINEIIRRRETLSNKLDESSAERQAQLSAMSQVKDNPKPFFSILDTRSPFAKGLNEAFEKVEKKYKELNDKIIKDSLKADDDIAKEAKQLGEAQRALWRLKPTDTNKGEVEALERKVNELENSLANLRAGRAKLDGALAQSRRQESEEMGTTKETYFAQYNSSRRLDVGIDAGATAYLETVKNKAERAKDVMMSFGQATEQALMSGSWTEAKNVAKTFFGSLLKQIQQTIVQLLIVKPLMEKIANFANNNFKAGGTDFFGGLLQAIVGGSVTGSVGSTMTPGTASGGQYSLSSGGVKLGYNALGGVFAGGQKVNYYADGGVFDRPTVFGGAGGLNVMGERGAEAVMPLKRDAKGRLGVAGGSSTSITNQLSITVQGNADKDTIAEMEQRLAKQMTEISRQQANNAIQRANRPGGANYRK
jgi:tape measure domain-containing protein